MNRTIGIISLAAMLSVALAVGASAAASETPAPAATAAPHSAAKTTTAAKLVSKKPSATRKAASATPSKAGSAKSTENSEVTCTAEVVDLNAYVTHATVPVNAGAPVSESPSGETQYGLLIDGKLYVPLMKDMTSSTKFLSDDLGKTITVTGRKHVAGGDHFFLVSSVGAEPPAGKS